MVDRLCRHVRGVCFLASFGFQLRASHSRWITHAEGVDALRIEDSRFDYYWSVEPAILPPDTHRPFGIGMLLQAAGLVFLVTCLQQMSRRAARWAYGAQFLLGLFAVAWSTLLGVRAVPTGITGELDAASPAGTLETLLLILPNPALLLWALPAWLRLPALAIALWCLGTTTPLGWLPTGAHVAPALSFSKFADDPSGTETILAASVALAGIAALRGLSEGTGCRNTDNRARLPCRSRSRLRGRGMQLVELLPGCSCPMPGSGRKGCPGSALTKIK